MLIKTVLNRIEKFKSYVYGEVTIDERDGMTAVVIDIRARKNSPAICSLCGERRAGYDRLESRLYEYVPCGGSRYFSVIRQGEWHVLRMEWLLRVFPGPVVSVVSHLGTRYFWHSYAIFRYPLQMGANPGRPISR